MDNGFKLIDYFQIKPDESLCSLSSREKVTFMDSILSKEDSRGLLITYDLSHSGRRINNRIYPVKGQQDGIRTILAPYPKPILPHHNSDDDPIGRFTYAEWQDLSSEALGFFTDINDFMEVKNAYQTDDPKKIYKVMKKHNLLSNKDWPGLGRMRVQARITDEKAVEKFLDGRYITFSAGSTTDRHVCSICSDDWSAGDFCEHRHGRIYDGDVCVFVTGTFKVLEGSVVNMPADDLSQVLSMEMTSPSILEGQDACRVDLNTIYLTDSTFSFTESNMPEVTVNPAAETVEKEATEVAEITEDSAEAVENESTEEVVETEAVDSEQSSELEDGEAEAPPEDNLGSVVNAVVAKLTELGILNKEANEDNGKTEQDELQIGPVAISNEASEETIEESKDKEGTEEKEEKEILDAELTSKKRNALRGSTFCGPDRSYPVPDKSHAANALARAKQHASSSLYSKIKACVCRKAKANSWSVPACDNASNTVVETSEYSCVCGATGEELAWTTDLVQEALDKEAVIMGWEQEVPTQSDTAIVKEDYVSALRRVSELEDKLNAVLDAHAELLDKDFSKATDEERLEVMSTWFDSIKSVDSKEKVFSVESKTIVNVENPSVGSADESAPTGSKKALGEFEKKIIDQYNEIKEADGAITAERYLKSKSRYLPRGFHPSNFINI